MITVPVVQAFLIGLLRLVAVAGGVYLYVAVSNNPAAVTGAGILITYALGGQAVDVLKVNKQIQDASTTTSVTVQQPSDTPAPIQLVAKTEAANQGPTA